MSPPETSQEREERLLRLTQSIEENLSQKRRDVLTVSVRVISVRFSTVKI